MTLDSFYSSTDSTQHKHVPDAHHALLNLIAQGAPLARTLSCIVKGFQARHQETTLAIFLTDEEGKQLHLGAGPGLHPDYRRALDAMASGTGAWLPVHAVHGVDEQLPSWLRFCSLARQHGLHPYAPIPIRSSAGCLRGMFVAYSHQAGQPYGPHRQSIADVAALTAIAIECGRAAGMRQAAQSLHENYDRMALALEGSGTGIWDRDVAAGTIHYSTGWKALFGYTEAQVSDRIEDSYKRVHPDDLAYVQATIQRHFDQKCDSYVVEHRILCADGSYRWASSRGKVVSRDHEGKPLRMIGTTTDITAVRTLSEQLRCSMELITRLTNEVPGLVFEMRSSPDGEAVFSYVSDGVREIYEITPQQLACDASLLEVIIHPDDIATYRASFEACAASQTHWQLEYRVVLPKQGLRWRQGNARPRRLDDGSTLWNGLITDVTERKHTEIQLQEFATIDFLTKLPNRRCFMARMETELTRVQRIHSTRTTVLMCDIDHFKRINDSHGHATGDLVLQHVAGILGGALRELDIVGRIGGEEFAIVLAGAGITEANLFAQRLQQHLAEHPLIEFGTAIAVTVSIGIAIMRADDPSVDATLYRSDMALYRAKERGRNRIEIDAA